MAQNAIGNSANIFLQGSQLYQGANSKIFDAINGAADMYAKMQAQREANLTSLREKQMAIDAQTAQNQLDPEKASLPILAKATQYGVDSLTPQEKALFQAAQQTQAAKVAIQPMTGQAYSPYAAISLGGAPPNAALGGASSVAGAMLPPPRVDGQPSTTEQFNQDMQAPPPIGASEKLVKIKDTTGMADTPAGKMEDFKANLDAAKDIAVQDAKTGSDQKKADFYKTKLQDTLDKMDALNEQLQKAGALKSASRSGVSNLLNTAAGAEIPFTGIKPGRVVEEGVNKKVASLRDQYDGLKSNAMQLLKNAANIAAGSMNSDAEQKLALSSFGDPNGSYEANQQAIKATANAFGTKDSKTDNTIPDVDTKLKAAGYSGAQIEAYKRAKGIK